MNDPNSFHRFITEVADVTQNNAITAIQAFTPTFSDLLSTSDEEIEKFVTTTHGANSGRAAADRIVIPPNAISALQAMLFELKDRQKCQALPTPETLNALMQPQLSILKQQRALAKEHLKKKRDSNLPPMEVPKFKGQNYDEFMTSFTTLVSRQTGVNDLPLDYLMRENETGNYEAAYTSREAKLKHCVRLSGDNFRADSKALYSLYVQHIGTTGTGSSVINRFKDTNNGYQCHQEFKQHFANDTYKDNLATTANQNMANAVYNGPKRNFSIETYYTIMTTAFNDLATAGTAHALNN